MLCGNFAIELGMPGGNDWYWVETKHCEQIQCNVEYEFIAFQYSMLHLIWISKFKFTTVYWNNWIAYAHVSDTYARLLNMALCRNRKIKYMAFLDNLVVSAIVHTARQSMFWYATHGWIYNVPLVIFKVKQLLSQIGLHKIIANSPRTCFH